MGRRGLTQTKVIYGLGRLWVEAACKTSARLVSFLIPSRGDLFLEARARVVVGGTVEGHRRVKLTGSPLALGWQILVRKVLNANAANYLRIAAG